MKAVSRCETFWNILGMVNAGHSVLLRAMAGPRGELGGQFMLLVGQSVLAFKLVYSIYYN